MVIIGVCDRLHMSRENRLKSYFLPLFTLWQKIYKITGGLDRGWPALCHTPSASLSGRQTEEMSLGKHVPSNNNVL